MRRIIYLVPLLFCYIIQAQCSNCTVSNPTDPNYQFPDNSTVCFTADMTFNNPSFGENVRICISSGVTVQFQNNVSALNNSILYFDVHGSLNFNQTTTSAANLDVHVYNGGAITVGGGNGNMNLEGSTNRIANEGTIILGVLQLGDNTNNIIDNYNLLTINGNLNMSNSAMTQFRNWTSGTMNLNGNYTNNEQSFYINCGTINSQSGFNINGGKIYNTGTFNVSGDVNLSGNSSEIFNYGKFISNGNMNNAPSDAIIYNEGYMFINQYQGGNAPFRGPASSTKKGYIEVQNAIQVNNATMGPNLDFKRTTGTSDQSTVFMNSNPTFLSNVTYDCASTNECSAPLVTDVDFCPTINAELPPMAVDDTYTINAGGSSAGTVLDNDFETYDGPQATLTNVILAQVSTTNTNINLNVSDAHIEVGSGTPSGTYTLVYQICQQAAPTNCDTATDTIIVPAAATCYKPAVTAGTELSSHYGITSLERAQGGDNNWPGARKGAWTVLESKTKGLVLNRLSDAQVASIPAADLKEGMIVYNTTQNCLQVNIDGTSTGWRCFNTQSCPD
ncbi:hypothetical protein [Chryseobacterium sp.]|uniref:hypothetical protein n=1 Tax=Chryseobacterium sp. TaxID=1871047 RepID=UPI0025BA9D99|nr:hypothetical protein [Chryseobacterium sp.]